MKLTFEIQFISVISLFSLISAGNLSYRIKGSRSTTVRHQQQQITETLPITNNHRRRLQADPKKGDPELDKKGEEPLPKDAKGIDPKKAKEKAGPMFDEMVSSNDCILSK